MSDTSCFFLSTHPVYQGTVPAIAMKEKLTYKLLDLHLKAELLPRSRRQNDLLQRALSSSTTRSACLGTSGREVLYAWKTVPATGPHVPRVFYDGLILSRYMLTSDLRASWQMVFVLPIRLSPLPGLFLRGVLQANRFRYPDPVDSRFHALIQFYIATLIHVSIPPLPYQKGSISSLL